MTADVSGAPGASSSHHHRAPALCPPSDAAEAADVERFLTTMEMRIARAIEDEAATDYLRRTLDARRAAQRRPSGVVRWVGLGAARGLLRLSEWLPTRPAAPRRLCARWSIALTPLPQQMRCQLLAWFDIAWAQAQRGERPTTLPDYLRQQPGRSVRRRARRP